MLPLTDSLQASRGAVSALISLRGVFSGAFSLLSGTLADRYGPKRIISVGVLLTGLAWILSSGSTRLWEMYLFFSLLGGLGMSAIYVPVIAVVSRWFNLKRALALGIVLSSFGVSQTLLPPILSPLTTRFGWQFTFAVIGVIILCCGIPVALLVRRDPRESGLNPDGERRSAVLINNSAEKERDSWTRKEATASRSFWQIFFIYFSCAFCFQIVIFHIVARAVDAGVGAGAAALAVSFTGGAGIVGRLVVGGAVLHWGNQKVLMGCILAQIPAIFLFIVTREAWAFYVLAAVFGFGYGGVSPLVPDTMASFFGPRHIGAIFGVMTMAYNFGAAVGPVTAGLIFDATGSYSVTFALAGTVLIGNLVLSLFLKAPRKKPAGSA